MRAIGYAVLEGASNRDVWLTGGGRLDPDPHGLHPATARISGFVMPLGATCRTRRQLRRWAGVLCPAAGNAREPHHTGRGCTCWRPRP
jgi:hypothetical protein